MLLNVFEGVRIPYLYEVSKHHWFECFLEVLLDGALIGYGVHVVIGVCIVSVALLIDVGHGDWWRLVIEYCW